MSSGHPLLTRQRVLAAKAETTAGTSAGTSAADGVFNVFDLELQPSIEFIQREGQSSLSQLPGITGPRMGTCNFATELHGSEASGTNPAWADTFLLACGMSESSGTFSPSTGSDSAQTLTMDAYEDGDLRGIYGAMGTFTMEFVTGQPVRINFEFTGVYEADSAAAIIAPTYPTVKPPRFAGGTLTVGGTAYKVANMTIAWNGEITMREDPSQAAGYIAAYQTNRRVTVTMDPEAVGQGTKDWHNDLITHAEAALSVVVGSDVGNTMTIAAPKLQLTNRQRGDRNGLLIDNLEFQANRNASAGDDELTIAFS